VFKLFVFQSGFDFFQKDDRKNKKEAKNENQDSIFVM